MQKIKQLSKENYSCVKEIRRHIHMNPELSFCEYETSKYIVHKLNEIGLNCRVDFANNGVVAIIDGKDPNRKCVALRADIDALPIQEENNIEYKSKNNGVMHACGHDVHTASLLGVARILNAIRDEFTGTIKLIFQPAEEKNPGGAIGMIQAGVLENPKVNTIMGQHVDPLIPVGKVGFKSGVSMASADELYITVHGKGEHAASPHTAIDPIFIASSIIIALQQIVSRNCNPILPSVLSICQINAGEATNIIPNKVKIAGTFRTVDENWRFKAHEKMKSLACTLASAMGGSCDFDISTGYPMLHNDFDLTKRLTKSAQNYIGFENVVEKNLTMGAEDFAYYAQKLPGCFYQLGIQNNDKGINSGLHTPTFNIDETALEISPGLMAWMAIEEMK